MSRSFGNSSNLNRHAFHGDVEAAFLSLEAEVDALVIGGGGEVQQTFSFPSSTTWTINHNFGFRPTIELRTVGGQMMMADITHISVNQALVQFLLPTAGTAHCT